MQMSQGWAGLAGLCLAGVLAAPALAQEAATAGDHKVEFVAADDWVLQGFVRGEVWCDFGEPTNNPMQPCPPGSGFHVRGTRSQALITATDPRLTGTMSMTSNCDLDSTYSGRFWGTWSMPSADCTGSWEGTWWADRYKLALPGIVGIGTWVGDVRMVGSGRGCLRGQLMGAQELAKTYTPAPAAYEVFCPNCGTEGTLAGWILRLVH